jgi:hypothetical protein
VYSVVLLAFVSDTVYAGKLVSSKPHVLFLLSPAPDWGVDHSPSSGAVLVAKEEESVQ